jgi:DNA-binding NtrC family response regulator
VSEESRLAGKRILIVDDEPDVLESLAELLPMCQVVQASRFGEAKRLLEDRPFDLAILDIMGVDGYELLKIAHERHVAAVMLTARAISPGNIVKSYKEGAASFVPKEEMANMPLFLEDILEAKEKGKHFWWRWFDRMAAYCDKKFGPDWQKEHGFKVK